VTSATPPVDDAVAAVRDQYAGHPVEIVPDGGGGVYVIIDNVDVGERYTPSATWLGFQINAAYPISDVYPLYMGQVDRVDGQVHGEGIQAIEWQGRPALQLSRRSNRWNPRLDTAALKAEKVITWFSSQ